MMITRPDKITQPPSPAAEESGSRERTKAVLLGVVAAVKGRGGADLDAGGWALVLNGVACAGVVDEAFLALSAARF